MNHEEYLKERRQDPEYREVERRLKPILDLADDVFDLRMERGWTQAELAKRVGTKQANISRLENGMANPTLKFLQRLSEVFETDLTVRLRPQQSKVQTPVVVVAPSITAYQPGETDYVELITGMEYIVVAQEYIPGRIVDLNTGAV